MMGSNTGELRFVGIVHGNENTLVDLGHGFKGDCDIL